MKVFSQLKKAISYPGMLAHYYIYRIRQGNIPVKGKYIYLEVGKNVYKRYLYTLLKFFSLQGYSIYIRGNAGVFHDIRSENYVHYLLAEGIIRFGRPARLPVHNDNDFWSGNISPDYFNDNSFGAIPRFHFPMTQHPLMYHSGWWNEFIPLIKRKRSVFMAGNFDANVYSQTSLQGIFNTSSRLTVYEFLKERNLLFEMERIQDLYDYLDGNSERDVILIDRLKFDVPMDKLRNLLSRFSFFLALPGMIMPFSHNIIEAMSCGCIPLIEEEYASMFSPPLKNKTHVISFNGPEGLAEKLPLIFQMDEDEVEQMRRNVRIYYEEYLTPHKIIAGIEQKKPARIYLQAEDFSVGLLKNDPSYKKMEHYFEIYCNDGNQLFP